MVTVLSTEARTRCRNTVRHTHTKNLTHTHSHTYTKCGTEWLWWEPTPWTCWVGWEFWQAIELTPSLAIDTVGTAVEWLCALRGEESIPASRRDSFAHPKWNVPSQCNQWDSTCPPLSHPIPSHSSQQKSHPLDAEAWLCHALSAGWPSWIHYFTIKTWLPSVIYNPPPKIPVKCNIPWS